MLKGNMKNKKKTVLITGATSGIGYDFARIFAVRGYDLFLVSLDQKKLENIKDKFEELYGIVVTIMAINLAKPSSARKIYEETIHHKIHIHILVNNVGVRIIGEHTGLDMGKMEDMIQLNVITLTKLCALFGNEMKKKRKGYILNVASTAAYQPVPYIAAYGATKSYVLNFSEALAKELEDYHVVVTCLSPGPTETNCFAESGMKGSAENKKWLWAKSNCMESLEVAEIGVNALFAKRLSIVAGSWNSLFAFSNRLAPRSATALISKALLKKTTT